MRYPWAFWCFDWHLHNLTSVFLVKYNYIYLYYMWFMLVYIIVVYITYSNIYITYSSIYYIRFKSVKPSWSITSLNLSKMLITRKFYCTFCKSIKIFKICDEFVHNIRIKDITFYLNSCESIPLQLTFPTYGTSLHLIKHTQVHMYTQTHTFA